jgi:hypothetical protein
MKRLGLIALPFLLASPAFAADLDGPRYSEREVIIERRPTVVERHYYYRAPVVEYDDDDAIEFVERPRVYGFVPPYPEYYGWVGHRHHHHRHWRHRHHHHR